MERRGALEPDLVEYPESDGRPMAESDLHQAEMISILEVLRTHFATVPDTYVAGNNFVYWERGNTKAVVSPDVYVVKGVAAHLRKTFLVWNEGGHRPSFVLEVTSESTRHQDLGSKMTRYRDDLRVPEYFLFDLQGDWIPEHLRGYSLAGEVYAPIAALPNGRLPSHELGLELGCVEGHLRFFLPGEPVPLLTAAEQLEHERQQSQRERQRAEHERQRASSAEAEVARLEAELERLRRGDPGGT